jgi:hypothetical protein
VVEVVVVAVKNFDLTHTLGAFLSGQKGRKARLKGIAADIGER